MFMAAALAAETAEVPFSKVFDPVRRDGGLWTPEDPAVKMDLWSFEGVGTLRAKEANRSWGAVYRTMAVDLDQQPLLQINVLSAKGNWYLILAGEKIPKGYVRLTETGDTGLATFDVPALTGLKGSQTLVVKVGLSSQTGGPLKSEEVSFDKLLFTGRGEQTPAVRRLPAAARSPLPAKAPGDLDVFDPAGADVDAWQESAVDGPQEVRIQVKNGAALVKGRIDRNYGAASRRVTVDVDRHPFLDVRVLDCSKSWYVIVNSSRLPGGYARLVEMDKPGLFRLKLPKSADFSGLQTFDLLMGVSHPASSSIRGQWILFDMVRFKES